MTKYSLTLADMSKEELDETIAKLNGGVELTETVGDVIAVAEHVSSHTYEVTPVNSDVARSPEPVDTELDITGIPWDDRIHTSTKGQTKKGVWSRKPRVPSEEYDAVVAELKANVITQPVAQSPIAQPVATPMPRAPVAPAPIERNYQGLMATMGLLFKDQIIDQAYARTMIERLNGAFGSAVTSVSDIGADERMVEYAWQCLDIDEKVAK